MNVVSNSMWKERKKGEEVVEITLAMMICITNTATAVTNASHY